MTDDQDFTAARKPRADAERNHARLLKSAYAVFAEKGSNGSLDEIARAAGVGIGTLYRHFPTRDALIEAVYRNETDALASAALRLAETYPPVEALRQWLLVFVGYLATKQGMSEALASIVGGPRELYAASGVRLQQAIAMLVDRATASGEIALELEPLDLLRALAGLSHANPGVDWKPSAKRLVDIVIAGARTRKAETQKTSDD